jgi:hypothetical protein
MKSMRITFVALVAVFAISAVAASSALAAPEWYVKKAGVYAKVTTAIKVASTSKLELIDTKATPFPLGVSCDDAIEGAIKAGGAGEIEVFAAEECKGVEVDKVRECEKVESVEARDLPWNTELYKEGSEVRMRILTGSNTPAWRVTCKTPLGGHTVDTCGVNTSTLISNNVLEGLVEAGFESKSAKTECSVGGKESGEWKGVMKLKAKGTGVEAIKAE